MPAFRDDREGLRQRIADLEQDLSALQRGERNEALRRVTELERDLGSASKDLAEQRELLADIQRRTRALRETLDEASAARDVAAPMEAPKSEEAPVVARAPVVKSAPVPRRRRWWLVLVLAIVVGGAAAWFLVVRAGAPLGAIHSAPIPGAPHAIDPLVALEMGRTASGVDGELTAIQADVIRGALVDLDRRRSPDWAPLRFFFSDADQTVQVVVERDGLAVTSAPRGEPTNGCGDPMQTFPCGTTVPPPRCTMQQIWDAARKAGAHDDDQLFVSYAARWSDDHRPIWTIIVAQRGRLDIEDGSCEVPPRQRIQPRARPVGDIPGAPHAVDPLAILDLAKAQAGLDVDAVLTQIRIRFIAKNGRVDLDAAQYDGSIEYIFADPIAPRDPALPIGVTQPDTRRVRAVWVSQAGMPITPNAYDSDLYASYPRVPVAPPRCAPTRVFELAELPAQAVAQMTYVAAEPTPLRPGRWTVDVPDVVSGRVVEDAACAAPPPTASSSADVTDPGPATRR